MKLGTLVNANFQSALSKLTKSNVPLKTAFILKGALEKVQKELEKYEECRKEALDRLGDKDEEGNLATDENNQIKFSEENLKTFYEEMNELLKTEMDIPTVTVDQLGDKCEITAEELMALGEMIKG